MTGKNIFMSEIHLRQPEFVYSAFKHFKESNEKVKKRKKNECNCKTMLALFQVI